MLYYVLVEHVLQMTILKLGMFAKRRSHTMHYEYISQITETCINKCFDIFLCNNSNDSVSIKIISGRNKPIRYTYKKIPPHVQFHSKFYQAF